MRLCARAPLVCTAALTLSFPAFAGEVETWVGGAISSGVDISSDGLASTLSQVELDARLATGFLFLRLDLDAHVYPDDTAAGLAYPIPPEWAMVQLGREKYHVRMGVMNPNIGLQQWDEWQNYLPSYSILWSAQPSQILGVHPGMMLEDGTELFVYGGYDLGFEANSGGLGFAREAETYYAAASISAYPGQELDYYAAFGTFELYPLDALWVTVDGGGGMINGSGFGGGQVVVNLFPEAMFAPVVRGEALIDPKGELGLALGGLPIATASVGLRISPLETVKIGIEGKSTFTADDPAALSGIVVLSLFRPEPEPYAASYEEEE